MADKAEKKTEDSAEGKKKGKLIPILLGIFLVVGAAIGTVAVVLPPSEEEAEEEVAVEPLDARTPDGEADLFPAKKFVPDTPNALRWTFTPNTADMSRKGVLRISFRYRTREPEPHLKTLATIADNLDEMRNAVRLLLADKSPSDLAGKRGLEALSNGLLGILNEKIFPGNYLEKKNRRGRVVDLIKRDPSEIEAEISKVFISNFLID